MDATTLKPGDRINHPDFGDGEYVNLLDGERKIEWDRRGSDNWADDDKRWEQVLLA
jgi:hypothetical protein